MAPLRTFSLPPHLQHMHRSPSRLPSLSWESQIKIRGGLCFYIAVTFPRNRECQWSEPHPFKIPIIGCWNLFVPSVFCLVPIIMFFVHNFQKRALGVARFTAKNPPLTLLFSRSAWLKEVRGPCSECNKQCSNTVWWVPSLFSTTWVDPGSQQITHQSSNNARVRLSFRNEKMNVPPLYRTVPSLKVTYVCLKGMQQKERKAGGNGAATMAMRRGRDWARTKKRGLGVLRGRGGGGWTWREGEGWPSRSQPSSQPPPLLPTHCLKKPQ
jgi:hypothetical protein